VLEFPALILVCVSIFGFLNHRYLKLPLTVGLVIIALVTGLGVMFLDIILPSVGVSETLKTWLNEIDFNTTLMNGMLSFLLFAGALHVDLNSLMKAKIHVSVLATVGVMISTLINGTCFYYFAQLFVYFDLKRLDLTGHRFFSSKKLCNLLFSK